MPTFKYDITRTTATIIVGFFQILVNVAGVAFFVSLFVHANKSCSDEYYTSIDGTTTTVCTRNKVDGVAGFVLSLMLMGFGAGVFLSILMVIGIFKKAHELMAPFVYFGIIGLLGSGIIWIIAITVTLLTSTSLQFMLPMLLSCIGTQGLQYILWYPIYSLYMEFKEKANTTQNAQRDADGPLLGSYA